MKNDIPIRSPFEIPFWGTIYQVISSHAGEAELRNTLTYQ